MERNDLIERLRKRAEDEREIQRNNEAVAEALSGQLEAFHRRDGSHNNFAVRLGLDHRSCAKKDASLAADWEEAATTIATLSEALVEAEKKGAEDWQSIETAPKDGSQFLAFGIQRPFLPPRTFIARWEEARAGGSWVGPKWRCQPTHWRPLPAPPRDLSQGGQHG